MSEEGINEQSARNANKWLDDQNEWPSLEKLRRLADEKSVKAQEELYQIADNFNVKYETATSLHDLVDRIALAMEQEADNKNG